MRLSIALCTYNGAPFLADQWNSLEAQHRLPDEVVVCDDCSDDGTVDYLTVRARRAPFPVRILVNEKRLGSTKNFEKAVSLCEGDLIALCDQDDVWMPQKLARIEAVFESEPAVGLVFSDAEVVDGDLKPLGYRLWEAVGAGPRKVAEISAGRAVPVLVKGDVVTGATAVVRRALAPLILPIPQQWVHDAWVALLAASVARLWPVAEPLIRYRLHASQQIGARRQSLGWRIAGGLKRRRAWYGDVAQQYRMALDRLLSRRAQFPVNEDVLGAIRGKVRHYNQRASMDRSFIRRLRVVGQELVAGHYHRYGSGWWSVCQDLIGA